MSGSLPGFGIIGYHLHGKGAHTQQGARPGLTEHAYPDISYLDVVGIQYPGNLGTSFWQKQLEVCHLCSLVESRLEAHDGRVVVGLH